MNTDSFDVVLDPGDTESPSQVNIDSYLNYIDANGFWEEVPSYLNPIFELDKNGNPLPISEDGTVYRRPDGTLVRGIIYIHKRTYIKN